MPLYGKDDANTSAPKNSVDDKNNLGTEQYGNTIFGVDTTEVGLVDGPAHSGWVRRVAQRGPLLSITIDAAGTGYANTDTFSVEAATGANTEGTIGTNGDGGITSVTITTPGGTFYGTETITITTSAGDDAVLTPVFGGRAGRVQYEVMVAQSSMVGDGDDDTLFPDS